MSRASNNPAIVIIGSGFSGLGMAIRLKQAGHHNFVILEKNDDLGGTWRDNQYPGCACDVPSHMYSFSFELNPDWSRMFAPQEEIWAYLRRCADKYGVAAHIHYGRKVERIEWDDDVRRWQVATTSGDVYTTRAVVSGSGGLHVPSIPEIPGADTFAGPAFHSAQWDHSCDLSGKRVAVIGTGASAIQFVPQIAKQAGQVYVFQRTPPWLDPRPDFEIPPAVRAMFRAAPPTMRAFRDGIYWLLESRGAGFAVHPRLMAPLQRMAERQIERQIDDPGLRAKVTPDYMVGCKRLLLSSDYYPALTRPNVDLVTDPIAGITETGLVMRRRQRLRRRCDHLRHRFQDRRGDHGTERVRTRRRQAPGRVARRCRGLSRHHRPRVPEFLLAARPEHGCRAQLGRLHDRKPGPACDELPAAAGQG